MIVTAHYTDGTTKEVEEYTINQTEKLDGTSDEIEITYKEDGITKTVIQKITVSGKPYTVEISELTYTGFNVNLSLTEAETSEIKEVKYYINDSLSGTNYQTTGIVTGLSDYTKRYVWAEVTYNSGITKKSNEYKVVYTAHSHNSSCYRDGTPSYHTYKYYSSRESVYKSYLSKWKCNLCGWINDTQNVARLSNYYSSNIGEYDIVRKMPCHIGNASCYGVRFVLFITEVLLVVRLTFIQNFVVRVTIIL